MVDFTRITQHAVSFHTWILIVPAILFSAAVTNGGAQRQSKSCTDQQATKNRNSFSFRTFGNVSSLERCVDVCCGDDTCELAILSKGFHCFGVSCSEPKLCHRILDRLLMDDEVEFRRSSRNTGTKDFIRHTSQISNPRCPQRFVPSFQVLLLGSQSPRDVYKLRAQSTDASHCSAQCCRSRDCLLSFIEDDECYGVTGAWGNGTKPEQGTRIGLQIAVIGRNKEVSRSLDDDDEDPDELGSDDVDNDTPAAKQEIATLKSKSKRQHSTKIPKRGKDDKTARGKSASSLTIETKRTSESGAHLAAKSGARPFTHNGADKNVSEISNTVGPSDSTAKKVMTIRTHNWGNETLQHKQNLSEIKDGNRPYQTNSVTKLKGSKLDTKSRNDRSKSFASPSAEGGNKEGSSQDFDSNSHEKWDLSGDGDMSGNDDSSGDGDLSGYGYGYLSGQGRPPGAVKDSRKGYKDVIGEGEEQNDDDDEFSSDSSGGGTLISGNDDDFSGDSVDTIAYKAVRREASTAKSKEYEKTRKTVDTDYSVSGDRESNKRMGDYSKNQRKKDNKKGKELDLVEALDDLDEDPSRKSGNVIPLTRRNSATMKNKMKVASSHPKSEEGFKEIKKGELLEDPDDLDSEDADSEKTSEDVGKLRQEANNSKTNRENANKKLLKLNQKDSTRKKSDLIEDADDLELDSDDDEKISEKVEHLLHETSVSKSAKKREKVDKQLKFKQADSPRKKIELVKDPDELGSNDDDDDDDDDDGGGGGGKIAKNVGHLLQETRISTRAKKREKADNKPVKLNRDSNIKKSSKVEVPGGQRPGDGDIESERKVSIAHKQTSISGAVSHGKKIIRKHVVMESQKEEIKRKESELAGDQDDLGSDDDEKEKASKAISRLSKQTSTSEVTKKGKNRPNYKKEGIVREKMDFVQDLDDLGSDDSDQMTVNEETSKKVATTLPPQTKDSRTGSKQQKVNGASSTKEKISLVQDLNDLGSDDDQSKSKLGKHDTLTPTKVTQPSRSGEKKRVGYLKTNDEHTTNNLKLADDLDDLGVNDDYVDQTKAEKPASRKNARSTLRTNIETIYNISQLHDKQRKFSGGNMSSKPRNKITKQPSTTLSLLVVGGNKSKVVSRQSGHSLSSGLHHHGINRKAGHMGQTPVKGKSSLLTESHVKEEKQKLQTMNIKVKKPGHGANLEQMKKPSSSTKTKTVLNSKSKKAVHQKTRTKGDNTNPHQTKLTITEGNKARKVPPPSETFKSIHKNRTGTALLSNQTPLAKTKKGMAPAASEENLKASVKAHINIKNHNNAASKGKLEKSMLKDTSMSTIKVNNFREKDAFKRKDAEKRRKTPSNKIDGHKNRRTFVSKKDTKTSSKVSSRLEAIDDLMKFAHLKSSVKEKPFVKKKLGHFEPSEKKTTFGKTTLQRQGREKVAINHYETRRGKQQMAVHPTKPTTTSVYRKKVNNNHLQSASKLAATISQTTAGHTVSLHAPPTAQDQLSWKKNRPLSSPATVAFNVHSRMKETNVPERNNNTSNKAFLSLKQRSKGEVLQSKGRLLAHFHNVNGSDGVEFSVKSGGSHHKEKHSKHELPFDLDDLGDADFDIMMSNDLPHKDVPEKKNSKQQREKHLESAHEKQRDSNFSSLKKKRKNKGGASRHTGDDNSKKPKQDSRTHPSHHKHKEIINDFITRKRHHQRHQHLKETHNDDDNNDSDQTHFSKEAEKSKSYNEKKSNHHNRHDKSSNADQKDSESMQYHHTKHRHQAKTTEEDNFSDYKDNQDDKRAKSDHKKRRKDRNKAKNNDKSGEDEKVEHHNHRSHKTHMKKYNNDWVGRIIPGKVKLIYEGENNKRRHHKQKIRDDDKSDHHGQKHVFEAKNSRADDSEDTESNKDVSRSYDGRHVGSDNYNQHEKHPKNHESVDEDDSDEKQKIQNKDNEEEHAEKKTEVNFEAIKTDRHRFVQHEDEEGHRHEGESRQGDEDDRDRDDDNSWTSKKDDKDDKNEKGYESDDAGENDADNDGDEERPSKEAKTKMVVLGEDSDPDEGDDAKHSERSHERRHGHGHENEHNINEQEDEKDYSDHEYKEEHYKSSLHNRRRHRHKHDRHLKSKHRHYESEYEDKEVDNNGENDDDDEADFTKTFIRHRKKEEAERRRHHYESERNRGQQHYLDTVESSKYNKEHRARKFHRSHHRYHHSRPVTNDRMEKKPVDGYELDEEKYHGERQYDEGENFPRHHHIQEHRPTEESEDNYGTFQREKEGPDSDFAPPEHDRERWKFKPEKNHRDFKGASHQLDNQDLYDHRLMEEENRKGYHHSHRPDYNERPNFKFRKRKKKRWKNRHYYYNDNDDQDYEDSGGLFDSSSWNPNGNYDDDDDFYGGEGNHERRHHRRKHHKYKNRKDRQSYEYWAYGNQNPYYYGYKYHRFRSGYENNQRQASPYYDWRSSYRSYNRWKPKPSHWYVKKQRWDQTRSWRHHPKWRQQFDDYKPTGYQWHKFYDNNGYYRDRSQPTPTPYPRQSSTFLPPTNPIWQKQLDATEERFRADNWPSQNRGSGKNYQDWSRYRPSTPLNQATNTYGSPQLPPAGFQPRPNPDAVKPADQTHPLGVVSNYVPPASQQGPGRIDNHTRFRPTVRRQYPATPPLKVLRPTNDFIKIKNLMDKLNTSSSASISQRPSSVTSNVQNKTNTRNGLPKINVSSSGQNKDQSRLNGFFNEENGGKKSDILRPKNNSQEQPARNVLVSVTDNTTQPDQHTLPRTTSTPAKLTPQPTQVANKTSISHTTPMHTTNNHTTSTPSQVAQTSSTTATPTQKSRTEHSPVAVGDVSQSDDSSETGKKHRKHRAPVCIAGKTTDDITLLQGKKAGNFTNIGDVGDFGMCIKRCCQQQKCDLAFKSAETCFLVSCFSEESCKTSPSLDDIFSPRMCFVRRHLLESERGRGHDDDDDDEWNDKVSPSGIHEVCEAEKALGIMWKKTAAGHYSRHPCPREAKGFVKRRCEADSRWLPPNFSDCVSNDYQALFDRSRKLAGGADPSPLIRDLSLLTTQNIDNSLIFGGDLDRATDIMAAIVQHNGQTDSLDMTREDVENFVRASSNLLDMTNQQEWFNIQKNKPGSAGVLRLMEMFALQAARRLPREDMADPAITSNIIIKLDRKSPGEGGLTFPDFSNPRVDRWDARHDVIALPSSVFDQGEVSTASINFKSLPYLLPDTNVSTGLGPNSKVISTVMHPHPQGKITPPVTVVLTHIKRRRGNPKCVFWDYTLSPHRGGAWSSRGCWLAFNNQSHSICQCSHLSNFAVLMDLSSDESLQKEQKRERTMALMWIGIPVLIVGVIGGLYMSFSWNRKSGIPNTLTRPSTSLNEKTGLLGQRVVTSQVREEFPPSPTRDLYRALSPGYSPTGDLEWQDEFDFDVESGDQRFKQMLLPKLQLLQNQLINEFCDAAKMESKKKLFQGKIEEKIEVEKHNPDQGQTDSLAEQQKAQLKPIKNKNPVQCEPSQKRIRQSRKSSSKKLRVRFADESPPGRNLTDEDKERFKRLQRMERRVFAQHLSRWRGNSHLNLPE